MDTQQATAIVALLSAAFPREPMPDSTVSMWSQAMGEEHFEDASVAVEIAALTYDRMPSLHQVTALCRDARRKRWEDSANQIEASTQECLSFTEWLRMQPPEMHERVKAIGLWKFVKAAMQ